MELRLLTTAIRLLDPRAWKRRLAQLCGGLFAAVWIWVRAVRAIDGVRRRRDLHQTERERQIVERLRAEERDALERGFERLGA